MSTESTNNNIPIKVRAHIRNGIWGAKLLKQLKQYPPIETSIVIDSNKSIEMFMAELKAILPPEFKWNPFHPDFQELRYRTGSTVKYCDFKQLTTGGEQHLYRLVDGFRRSHQQRSTKEYVFEVYLFGTLPSKSSEGHIRRATTARIAQAAAVISDLNEESQVQMGRNEARYLATHLARRPETDHARSYQTYVENPTPIGLQLNYLDRELEEGSSSSEETFVPIRIQFNGVEQSMKIDVKSVRLALGLPAIPLYREGLLNLDADIASPQIDMSDVDHADTDD